jgi:hypothetical protein
MKKKQKGLPKNVQHAELVEMASIDIRECEEKLNNYIQNPTHYTIAYLESLLGPMLVTGLNLRDIAQDIRGDK